MRTLAVVVFALASPVLALDDAESSVADEVDGVAAFAAPASEVRVGGAIVGEELGGATGFLLKEGFYVQGTLGGFFRFGGFTSNETTCPISACEPASVSDLQPLVVITSGYDLAPWLSAQASLGMGFVADAAVYGEGANVPRDYALPFADVGIVAQHYVLDRVSLALTLAAGASVITPEPGTGRASIGANTTVGLGVRLASLLPDTFVGFEGYYQTLFVPGRADVPRDPLLVVHALSFAPVIKYVF